MSVAPAHISHVVIVHAGSYKDFMEQLSVDYPGLHPIFLKKVAIHYWVIQLEDYTGHYDKKQIYKLPVMALREELSKMVFFKNTKSYNTVLLRMCQAKENKDAVYELFQQLLTPFEKRLLANLESAKKITLVEQKDEKTSYTTSYFSHDEIISTAILGKIFPLEQMSVDDKAINFLEEVKKLDWGVRIYR